ncbi:MAG: flagellar basal body rod protein FlgB [Labilithrix sp.]
MGLLDGVENLRGALDYHLERHNLLASNLAHIDTPGYKPVDLERTGNFAGELQVAMTSEGHMQGSSSGTAGVAGPGGKSAHGKIVEDTGSDAGGDNNGVDLDREAVKIASNQMRYDMIAQLASSQLQGLEWAATDGKRG